MKNLHSVVIVFCVVLLTNTLFAANYYVSPTGNNANDGSVATPWLTVQYSVDQLQPGDFLFVQPGIYFEKITLHVSGTASLPITITGSNQSAVLDGTGNTTQTAMIDITDQSYLQILQLGIRNNVMNDAQGILVSGNCQGIELKELAIHDIHFSANPNDVATAATNAQGIIVLGTNAVTPIRDLIIRGNSLYNCRLGYSEGIAVNGNVDGFEVTSNTVFNLTNIGIVAIGHEENCTDPLLDQARNGMISQNTVHGCHSPYAACGGVYIDGAKAIQVTRNYCYDNDYGIEIGCEHAGKSAENITVRNNLLRHNHITGIAFGGYDYPTVSGKVINSTVYNNTLYKNDSIYDGNGELTLSYFENCFFENNIFFTNDQLRAVTAVNSVTALNLNYNLYFTPSSDQSELIQTVNGTYTLAAFQQTGQELNGLFDNPYFGNDPLDINSFRMIFNVNSLAIDHGNPSYQPLVNELDFFGLPRLNNLPVDMGASEFWMEDLSESALTLIEVFPNPTSNDVQLISTSDFVSFTIFDLTGKMVAEGKLENKRISLANLTSGSYLIRFYGASGMAQSRVVKW